MAKTFRATWGIAAKQNHYEGKGGRLDSMLPEVRSILQKTMPVLVKNSAEQVLETSNELVPQPGKSRGLVNRKPPKKPLDYSTGALKASGYIATDEASYDVFGSETKSGYFKAVADAMSVPKSRVARRDQIADPVVMPRRSAGSVSSTVAYAVTYADLIHNGFFHVGAGKYIIGTNFLLTAAREQEPRFLRAMQKMVKDLEKLQVLSDDELAAEAAEADRDMVNAAHRASVAKEKRDLWKEFVFETDPELLKRQTAGGVRGYKEPKVVRAKTLSGAKTTRLRQGQAMRYTESIAEWHTRVNEMFDRFKRGISEGADQTGGENLKSESGF